MRGDRLHRFVERLNGRFVTDIAPGVPNGAGAQCVNLFNLWLAENGRPAHAGNAGGLMVAVEAGQYPGLRWVENGPRNVPPRGAGVVWGYSQDLSAGHVDVFLYGGESGFVGFDQNWPEGSPCHREVHDYEEVSGWIVLKHLRLR